jgi:serine/threonine protein kinase
MAYIEGKSLREVIKEGKLTVSEAIDLTMQICEGLNEAHTTGVVHRDIKPGNIFIDRKNKARLLDFGLATVTGEKKLTKTGSTLGTVGYMSPEQVRGEKTDHRSDLFSVGILLYEMITDKLPFEAEHEAAIQYKISNEVPEPLARFKKDVPNELQRIVSKCLAKDPSERYQGAAELVADLRSLKRRQTASMIPSAAAERRKFRLPLIAMLVILVGAAVAIVPRLFQDEPSTTEHEAIMLAVLPFQNMGSTDDEVFASGVTEEILTNLSQIPGLGVISRTSTMKYKERTQSIKEIGEELGVEYILEASIQWDKSGAASRIRLHPQLIRASDDVHVWAQRYDAIIDDIFEVQSTIAAQVAGALSLALLPAQADPGEVKPTENPRAYELYLQAKGYASVGIDDGTSHRKAVELYRKAIRLDSTFALARAGLSKTISGIHFWTGVSTLAREAKSEALMALELSPGLPQGHIALGQYYNMAERNYEKALEEFTKVRFSGVDKSEVLSQIGFVHMRQGSWHEALADFEGSFKHDPLSWVPNFLLNLINTLMRRHDDALRYADRLISVDPSNVVGYRLKISTYITGKGQPEMARRTLREAAEFMEPLGILAEAGIDLFRYGLTEDTPDELLQRFLQRNRTSRDTVGYHLALAQLYVWSDDSVAARAHADSARAQAEAELSRYEADPGSGGLDPAHPAHLNANLGLAYALLGQKEQAIEHAEIGVRTLPVDECHW